MYTDLVKQKSQAIVELQRRLGRNGRLDVERGDYRLRVSSIYFTVPRVRGFDEPTSFMKWPLNEVAASYWAFNNQILRQNSETRSRVSNILTLN